MKNTIFFLLFITSFYSYGQVPDWTETSCDGDTYNMYTELQNGNAVILDFSSMWCPPCIDTAPEIESVWQQYGQGTLNVKVFGFLMEDNSYNEADCADVNTWETSLDLTYPGFANPNVNSLYTQYNALYGNSAIPLILVFIPDTQDPGNSAMVYTYGTGTVDISDDIGAILSDNNYWAVGLEELDSVDKEVEVVKILDFMGRETEYKANTPLIYIYSDGTRKRMMKIE